MLEGVKVIEMASIAAGPVAATMLAEWGADVLKIEPLEGDRGRYIMQGLGVKDLPFDPDLDLHNRGKKSLALDLARPEAHEIIESLIKDADIFITNMLSDKLAERNLDWAHLSKVNPRLVHASISGYGATGPDAQLRAIDHTAFWSRSGLAHLMTPKGQEPVPIRRAMGDRITATALVAGCLAAYIEVQRTGRGKVVETSLLRAAVFTGGADIAMQVAAGRVGSSQPRKSNVNPMNGFFPTKDGRWIAANLGQLAYLDVLGHPEILDDPRFQDAPTRRKHNTEVIEILDSIFRERTMAEWVQQLRPAEFTWAPVQNAEEVVNDPQALAAGALVDVPYNSGQGSYRAPAMPVGFLDEDGKPEGLPKSQTPDLGGHTDEILAGLGYSADRIADLRARRIVR